MLASRLRQYDDGAASGRIGSLPHILRSFVDSRVEVVLLTVMLRLNSHYLVRDSLTIAGERLHERDLVREVIIATSSSGLR